MLAHLLKLERLALEKLPILLLKLWVFWLDQNIARALYTSISFDTQLFRFVKSSSTSHLISAELIEYEKNPEEIHRHLFSTYTIGKVNFLAQVLNKIEFFRGIELLFC